MTTRTHYLYQVYNRESGLVLGTYAARNADDALDACSRDAGYLGYVDACINTNSDDLVATLVG